MKKPIFNKIVWAVDTMDPVEFQKNAKFVIGCMVKDSAAEVFPVTILTSILPSSDPMSTYEEAYLALSEKRMKELDASSNIKQMRKGQVIISRDTSVRVTVGKLLETAKEKGADAIVVSTHSHGGVERFFVGSFAETLLLQSDISVVTVNPNASVREDGISRILFPTTFDERMRPAFEKTVELCSRLDANLTVFYKEKFIPMLQSSFELIKLLEEEALERKEAADRYREWADSKDVPIEFKIDPVPGKVAEEIVAVAAEQSIDLIAMVSRANRAEGPRIGSICRKVVRKAQCPVWTFKS